jgi:AraC family transcriptional regulator
MTTNNVAVMGQSARLRRWWVQAPRVYLPHSHAQTSFEVVLKGGYVETVQGQAMPRKAGGAYLVVADVPHACHYTQAVQSLSLEFLREEDNWQLQKMQIVQVDGQHLGVTAQTVCAGLICEAQQPDEWSGVAIDAYGAELLVAVLRQHMRPTPTTHRARLSGVLSRLHDAQQEPASVHELATLARLHPGHLAKLFRRELGVPIASYQRQLRLRQAAQRLADGTPTVEAALAAGYGAQSQFSTAFKKAFAMSPGQYRKLHQSR